MIEELTLLIDERLPVDLAIAWVGKIIGKHLGEILKVEDEGVKRLAYSIEVAGRRYEQARYLYFEVELEQRTRVKLVNELNELDWVLRYLLLPADRRKNA